MIVASAVSFRVCLRSFLLFVVVLFRLCFFFFFFVVFGEWGVVCVVGWARGGGGGAWGGTWGSHLSSVQSDLCFTRDSSCKRITVHGPYNEWYPVHSSWRNPALGGRKVHQYLRLSGLTGSKDLVRS